MMSVEWNKLSRIDDHQMKELMIKVVAFVVYREGIGQHHVDFHVHEGKLGAAFSVPMVNAFGQSPIYYK